MLVAALERFDELFDGARLIAPQLEIGNQIELIVDRRHQTSQAGSAADGTARPPQDTLNGHRTTDGVETPDAGRPFGWTDSLK
jgi:hypothetical protein